ncbi:MAG: VPLPA-CTERM sorting domain-containing protein [Pseudomonadota bacterium]
MFFDLRRIALAAPLAALALPASSATIDVLWLSGNSDYNNDIQTLASQAPGFDPSGDGALTWDLTLWNPGAALSLAAFDVLVIGSTCNTPSNASNSGNCSGSGFFGTGVDVGNVLSNKAEIEAARGNRTFISGQDADWHYTRDSTPGPNVDDGPKGFLINAVNWAASGTGLGIVSMTDRIFNNNGWWDNDDSFLKDELGGAAFAFESNTVNIGPGQGGFPINEGLSSAGLSNWGTSSHACLDPVTGYTAINIAPTAAGSCAVTLVTSAGASGGTSGGDDPDLDPGVIPLPAGGWLLISGMAAILGLRRRRRV